MTPGLDLRVRSRHGERRPRSFTPSPWGYSRCDDPGVDERSLQSGYRFEDEAFRPTGEMVAINERLSRMALLL
jgi:hypothetical protein